LSPAAVTGDGGEGAGGADQQAYIQGISIRSVDHLIDAMG